MQYLLTEEEYNSLKNGIENNRIEIYDTIQELCVQVAELKPVLFWGREEPEIWGCCKHSDNENNYGYCDECPAQSACPDEHKLWSK